MFTTAIDRAISYHSMRLRKRMPWLDKRDLAQDAAVAVLRTLPKARDNCHRYMERRVRGAMVDGLRAWYGRQFQSVGLFSPLESHHRKLGYSTSPDTEIFAEEFWLLVHRQLTGRERLVIDLIYQDGRRQAEVAAILNVTDGRVSQIHRAALAKLRRGPLIIKPHPSHTGNCIAPSHRAGSRAPS